MKVKSKIRKEMSIPCTMHLVMVHCDVNKLRTNKNIYYNDHRLHKPMSIKKKKKKKVPVEHRILC